MLACALFRLVSRKLPPQTAQSKTAQSKTAQSKTAQSKTAQSKTVGHRFVSRYWRKLSLSPATTESKLQTAVSLEEKWLLFYVVIMFFHECIIDIV